MFVFVLLSALFIAGLTYSFCHYLQLNQYFVFKSLKNFLQKCFFDIFLVGTLSVAFLFIPIFVESFDIIVLTLLVYIFLTAGIKIFFEYRKSKSLKTPLVLTNRVKRLFLAGFGLSLILNIVLFIVLDFRWYALSVYIMGAFYLGVFSVSTAIINIFERMNNARYVKNAQKMLDAFKDLIKIGVTGSYGKTSVKNILTAMCAKKFDTVATLKNYNTPLGIVKTLPLICQKTQVFVAEMGARRQGDIKELCDIVKPCHGILTGIAEQHMETFKSVENIITTKKEFFSALKTKGVGVCIVNADDEVLKGLSLAKKYDFVRLAGIADGKRQLYCAAQDIKVSHEGSEFTLQIADGTKISIATKLIGQANILNITMSAALAYHIGVEPKDIAEAVSQLEPVAHRQEVKLSNGMTIIDDTYNSNPVGAHAALQTLDLFFGRKLIVACGFAEQGSNLAKTNGAFGEQIAGVVDVAILIGAGAASIEAGLIKAEFDTDNIYKFASLKEAQKSFGQIFRVGDIILFENDMPDNLE